MSADHPPASHRSVLLLLLVMVRRGRHREERVQRMVDKRTGQLNAVNARLAEAIGAFAAES